MDEKPDAMPEGVRNWIAGYLYAEGIVEPTLEEFEDAVDALTRWRGEIDVMGGIN